MQAQRQTKKVQYAVETLSSNEYFKVSTITKLLMWHRRGSLGDARGHPNHSRSRTWTNSNLLFSFTYLKGVYREEKNFTTPCLKIKQKPETCFSAPRPWACGYRLHSKCSKPSSCVPALLLVLLLARACVLGVCPLNIFRAFFVFWAPHGTSVPNKCLCLTLDY